ncbi:MAG: GNAT family N-acetyltransferase, partial [Methanobacteriota archaeon]
ADCHRGTYPKTAHTGTIGIAVRDGWREAGLGRVLMGRLLAWMPAMGLKKAVLSVFATNDRARRLYASLGFAEEGVLRRQVRIRGAYVDEVEMGLWLGEA